MSSTATSRNAPGELTWLWLMVVAAVLTQSALNLLRPVTSYKLIALGANEAAIGLATSAYALLPLLTAMWLGRLTERLSSLRAVIALGAAIMALSGVGLAWGNAVWMIMVASAVLGLGHLMFTIGGQAVIGRRAPGHRMDAAFGWFTAAYSVGQMAGPLLSGLILGNTPLAEAATTGGFEGRISAALWWGAAISLLAVPVMFAMRGHHGPRRRSRAEGPEAPQPRGEQEGGARDDARDNAGDGTGGGHDGSARNGAGNGIASDTGARAATPPADPGRPTIPRILKVPGVPSQMLAALALLAMLDILTAFMPLVGEAVGLAPIWVGVLLAVRGAASVLSRVFLPWFSARWSRGALVLASLFGSAVGIGLVPVVLREPGALWAALVLMAVGGLFLGLGQPLTMTLITQAVPTAWRSSALALRLVGNRIGQVALPAVAGLVAAPLGPAGGIWFACATLVASGLERLARPGGRRRPVTGPDGPGDREGS